MQISGAKAGSPTLFSGEGSGGVRDASTSVGSCCCRAVAGERRCPCGRRCAGAALFRPRGPSGGLLLRRLELPWRAPALEGLDRPPERIHHLGEEGPPRRGLSGAVVGTVEEDRRRAWITQCL